jgi:hypothetical protein
VFSACFKETLVRPEKLKKTTPRVVKSVFSAAFLVEVFEFCGHWDNQILASAASNSEVIQPLSASPVKQPKTPKFRCRRERGRVAGRAEKGVKFIFCDEG